MLNPIQWISLKTFDSIVNSISEEKIADMLSDFGYKKFGKGCERYLDTTQKKMARIIVAINRKRQEVFTK